MALTRDKIFWDAFNSHAAKTVEATRMLEEMFAKPSEVERLAREISDIEEQGDKITHDCVLALHQTWITPLDREEIHLLISKLDDVLDYVEAAAERIALYDLGRATAEAMELTRVLSQTAGAVARAVAALQNIQDAKAILDLCVEINKFENDADRILRRALARLFRKPGADTTGDENTGPYDVGPDGRIDPLDIMKWRDVYEILETATDRAEDVANIIEGIVLEHG